MTEPTIHLLSHERGKTPIIVGVNLLMGGMKLWQGIDDVDGVFIVSDANVAPLYLSSLSDSLQQSGMRCGNYVMAAGEASKSWDTLRHICEEALAFGCSRRSVMVALGGGVVGDVTGVAAALLARGVRLIHYPTTLMAQTDSAIGGKTAINTPQGKNLVGLFYQPRAVIADRSLLHSLDERHMKAGYAELIKYAVLGDEEFFSWLETNGAAVLAREEKSLNHAIEQGILMKRNIVEDDPFERIGRRALLNLGHTFGHAFEAVCDYDGSLVHGEAVAGGLEAAMAFSYKKNLCSSDDRDRVVRHIATVQLGDAWRRALATKKSLPQSLWQAMTFDKKNKGGTVTLILSDGIGSARVHEGHEEKEIVSFLHEFLEASLS